MTEGDDMDLDDLFAEARAVRPVPSADLLARILSDADAATARRPAQAPMAQRVRWRDWVAALGGWPALGGLVASTIAGLWIGVAPPTSLSSFTAAIWGEQVSVTFGVDEDPLSLLEG